MILLDTNIFLRIADAASKDSPVARTAVVKLHRSGQKLAMVPQNLFEFWAAATRPNGPFPAANGLGMSASRADLWLTYLHRNFIMLTDPPDLPERWRKLVSVFSITGRKSHDVRLVAAMEAHSLTEILTFNGQDFKRFAAIRVIDPHAV